MNPMDDPLKVMTDLRPCRLDQLIEDGYARRRHADLARIAAEGRKPRRSPARLRRGLGGAVAAGAAAAVAIALVGGNAPAGRNAPAPRGRATLDAKAAVLAAAENAAQQPTGQYWYTDQVSGQSYIVRPATGTYAMIGAATEAFSWWGAKSGMGEAFYNRNLPAVPATPHDAVLWRSAGSPSTLRLWAGDHYDTLTTAATAWQSAANPHGGGDFPGVAAMSRRGLQKLPTDPAKLAAMFLSPRMLGQHIGLAPGAAVPAGEVSMAKITMVEALLSAGPLPPPVRAGLIRALAAQPRVHAIGSVTDALGRHGVALASDDQAVTVDGQWGTPRVEQGTYRWREELVFDQSTGALLAEEEVLTTPGGPYAQQHPGFVIYYLATRAAGWTGTKPGPPAALPFGY